MIAGATWSTASSKTSAAGSSPIITSTCGRTSGFEGGYLTEWVHERYDGVGCALAIELKKVFMDEWTGVADEDHLRQLTRAFADAVPILLGELACGPGMTESRAVRRGPRRRP